MDTIDTVDNASFPRIKRPASSRVRPWRTAFSWLLAWEVYPIIFLATFLRLYQFPNSELDADQAAIFHLARHAVTHGLIPVTANTASIRILNPPATIYLLMSGAIFSANPISGVIVTALLNVLAVLLTYVVVRRYYGRFAASVATLFYAGAQLTVFYSTFLWNQNLLAPFVPLFLLAIFWGVIERRRGWLAPAVVLWGWMIQLHGSAVFLIIPLGLACLLAFRTLRWRDVFLASGLLLLIYSPYIVWEFASHFSDIPILLKSIGEKSVIDTNVIHSYLDFLSPYPGGKPPANPLSWQSRFYPIMHWGYRGMLLLTICAFGLALLALVKGNWRLLRFVARGQKRAVASPTDATTFWGRLRSRYAEFVATPWRCGLLVLLAWQILPVIWLLHHSLHIFDYYLLTLMPGPFILIGIFSAQVVEWLRALRFPWLFARFAFSLLLLALVCTLALGAVTRTLDRADGYNNPSDTYYTIADTQNALHETDSLAQVYHAQHVYIALDTYTHDALTYLSEQMHTPHTTFEQSRCIPLPGARQGPALMLFGPADGPAEALMKQATTARLVAQPARPGAPAFHLYLVQPAAASSGGASFLHNLALDASQIQAGPGGASSQLVTRWTVLRSALPIDGTTYHYKLRTSYQENKISVEDTCTLSSLQPGEQLLATFNMPSGVETFAPVSPLLTATSWTTAPYDPTYGPFHLETFVQRSTPEVPLRASTGGKSIELQNHA